MVIFAKTVDGSMIIGDLEDDVIKDCMGVMVQATHEGLQARIVPIMFPMCEAPMDIDIDKAIVYTEVDDHNEIMNNIANQWRELTGGIVLAKTMPQGVH